MSLVPRDIRQRRPSRFAAGSPPVDRMQPWLVTTAAEAQTDAVLS
jgi:hypothetical protein